MCTVVGNEQCISVKEIKRAAKRPDSNGPDAMERMSGRRRPMKRLNFKISNDSVVIDDDKQNCSKYQVSKPKQNEK